MLSKKIIITFFISLVFLSSCRKEDKISDQNPIDTTNNPPPVTPKPWNLPWPEWIFHHWVWLDESTQQSAEALVDDYLAHNIPVGAIIIDSPWETGYNTFEWNSAWYPDPQGMVDYFHSKNVKVFVWITNVIDTDVHPLYDYAKTNNYFMTSPLNHNAPAITHWWKGDGSLIDMFNPAAVAWWKTQIDKTLDFGIDGWKCDGIDLMALAGSYSPGKGGGVSLDEYSDAYYRLFFDYTRQRWGDDCVITARPIDNYGNDISGNEVTTFAPVDINFCGWVGDQDASFEGLTNALNNMYYSSDYGYLSFGSDIGGYREDGNFPPNMRKKELFIRWAQLGTFCPVMENGGGGEHRPWMFDQQTEDIYRKLAKLRHGCLVPYLMNSADSAFTAGVSMMTFFNKSDYSYLLGADIFVTPFLAEGTSISVHFPAGSDWVYLYDETKEYTGGTTTTLTIPYDEFPVFMRKGSSLINAIDFNSIQ